MRNRNLVLVTLAIAGCVVFYRLGFLRGSQQSRLKEDRQGQLALLLHTYRLVEATNWSRVHDSVGIQLLAVTRDYERRFGIETGTSAFAKRFAEARLIADGIQNSLVPISSILTNLPTAPDAKVTVEP